MIQEMSKNPDETPLESPIKIRWTGDARTKLGTRYIESRLTSREDDTRARAHSAYKTLHRQKTQVVVKTVEEAEGLAHHLERAVLDGDNGRVWTTAAHWKAFKRVRKELIDEMEDRCWGDQ